MVGKRADATLPNIKADITGPQFVHLQVRPLWLVRRNRIRRTVPKSASTSTACGWPTPTRQGTSGEGHCRY